MKLVILNEAKGLRLAGPRTKDNRFGAAHSDQPPQGISMAVRYARAHPTSGLVRKRREIDGN